MRPDMGAAVSADHGCHEAPEAPLLLRSHEIRPRVLRRFACRLPGTKIQLRQCTVLAAEGLERRCTAGATKSD
jgi:hypothetical protein